MNINFCLQCGKKINRFRRRHSHYCSDLCKSRHYDLIHRPMSNKKAMRVLETVVKDKEQEQQ